MIKLVSGRVEIRMGMDQKERSGEAGLGGIHPGPEGEVVAKTPLLNLQNIQTALAVQYQKMNNPEQRRPVRGIRPVVCKCTLSVVKIAGLVCRANRWEKQ